MSFQAYLDTIKEKTGKTPAEFKELAEKKGLLQPGVKPSKIVAWLNEDFGLGHGHAMAIFTVLKRANTPRQDLATRINKHFSGNKTVWHPAYSKMMEHVKQFGEDVRVDATDNYLSLLRSEKKFGIVQVTTKRLDIGIKLKGVPPTARLEEAGSWNTLVTHRVQILNTDDIDAELLGWLQESYNKAA
jgi:hypothetical protein